MGDRRPDPHRCRRACSFATLPCCPWSWALCCLGGGELCRGWDLDPEIQHLPSAPSRKGVVPTGDKVVGSSPRPPASEPPCIGRSLASRPLCEAAPRHGLTPPAVSSQPSHGTKTSSAGPGGRQCSRHRAHLADRRTVRVGVKNGNRFWNQKGLDWGPGSATSQRCDLRQMTSPL